MFIYLLKEKNFTKNAKGFNTAKKMKKYVYDSVIGRSVAKRSWKNLLVVVLV